ncbi:kirola [Artemisia annua]|uniref:Kirola n=1 Tax=Artemisia annua TaxID=35608 RepID=A0A2U1MKS4_ARTAN|nr:kirola [Artemisia annua]
MGLIEKKVAKIDIICNGDIIYGLFRYRLSELLNLAPEYFKSCKLQEGEWGAIGSIINWNYVIDGKSQVITHNIDAMDEKNKSLSFKVLNGDLLKFYKSFKAYLQVDGNTESSTVTLTFEYEKMNEDVPDPDSLLELGKNVIKYAETRLNPTLVIEAAQKVGNDIKIPQLQ